MLRYIKANGYFQAMLFLKDIAVARISDENISAIDVYVDEEIKESDEIDNIDRTSTGKNISTSNYNISLPSSASFTIQTKNKRAKKQNMGHNFKQQRFIDLEIRKLDALTESPAAPDDENMNFFKSILSYLKIWAPFRNYELERTYKTFWYMEVYLHSSTWVSANYHNQNYVFINSLDSLVYSI